MAEKKKILVVDDESDIARMAARIFGIEGYETDTAENGQEGLGKLPEGYDGIITDLKMPVLDGVGLIKQAREKGFHGFAYLMSGTPKEAGDYIKRHGLTKEEFFSSYCNGMLAKPFSVASIKDIAAKHAPK